jgi:peroxiredoxin Q/BCP
MSTLEVGAKAPGFELLNKDSKKVSLASYKGKKVIVYFYPAALTPGCSKEACDFEESLSVFASSGYVVIGISPDEPSKLAKFADKEGLHFELLSDPDLSVHKTYGAFGMKKLYGREYEGVIRSTFVVDEKGLVSLPLYNVKATGHVEMLKGKLGL